MKYQLLVLWVLALVAFSGAEFHCEMGTPYVENGCNSCNCMMGNLLACTEKACPGDDYNKSFNCVEGTVSKRGCNTCTCFKSMGTICTNKRCDD
ncbi:serine protease inhibitor I/II-like [Photinus pyralis]|uniref:serine protease inhibitor I/II-like n=1 Tax=Photinus pyralis TaxID=7054 RepID=UPI001266FA41|nr:serine protease inhibitor I/II-like [Photinus pyralis]XP_031357331.1 serine protease inhibitor I/II-like [Photinus pyralis]XP_031357335.1 serine protease inhibitor I/II-like [Photinus pyralis]